MALHQRISHTLAALEGIRDRLDEAGKKQLDGLVGTLGRVLDEVDSIGDRMCCTEGCWEDAAPRRLHCVRHGGDYVRFKDGRVIPVTVTELAGQQALRDVGGTPGHVLARKTGV